MAKSPQPVLVIFGFPLDLLLDFEERPLTFAEEMKIKHRKREREIDGMNELKQHIADFRAKHGLELYHFE